MSELVETSDSNSSIDSPLNPFYYKGIDFLKDRNLHGAMEQFKSVIEKQEKNTTWGFDSLIEIIKIQCELAQYDSANSFYNDLFSYIERDVTKNHSEECINSLLEVFAALEAVRDCFC